MAAGPRLPRTGLAGVALGVTLTALGGLVGACGGDPHSGLTISSTPSTTDQNTPVSPTLPADSTSNPADPGSSAPATTGDKISALDVSLRLPAEGWTADKRKEFKLQASGSGDDGALLIMNVVPTGGQFLPADSYEAELRDDKLPRSAIQPLATYAGVQWAHVAGYSKTYDYYVDVYESVYLHHDMEYQVDVIYQGPYSDTSAADDAGTIMPGVMSSLMLPND